MALPGHPLAPVPSEVCSAEDSPLLSARVGSLVSVPRVPASPLALALQSRRKAPPPQRTHTMSLGISLNGNVQDCISEKLELDRGAKKTEPSDLEAKLWVL